MRSECDPLFVVWLSAGIVLTPTKVQPMTMITSWRSVYAFVSLTRLTTDDTRASHQIVSDRPRRRCCSVVRTSDRISLSPVHASNNVEATFDFVAKTATISNEFIVKFCPFDKVECCFDIVAVFWQQCCRFRKQRRTKFRPFDKIETNWKCSICFEFVERTKFRHCCQNDNNVEVTFDFVERIVRLVAFDNVASTLLQVWTGL